MRRDVVGVLGTVAFFTCLSAARADDPLVNVLPPATPTPVTPVSPQAAMAPMQLIELANALRAAEAFPDEPPPRKGVRKLLHCSGGCYANVNTIGCSSCKAECAWIFGSCRTFFGEPCLKRPPLPVTAGPLGIGGPGCGCP
jgi:hypothetical protein